MHSLSQLRNYLSSREALRLVWYGPRLSDVTDLSSVFPLSGAVTCYGSKSPGHLPALIREQRELRDKLSVDDLVQAMLEQDDLISFLASVNASAIVPYDTSLELESFCTAQNIPLLSAPDSLKDILRDKTRIDEISAAIGLPSIPGRPGVIDEFEFEPLAHEFGLPLFLHFAEGAGGTGNWIVHTKDEFEGVKRRKRGARLNVKRFFVGSSYTIDICVLPQGTVCGPLEEMVIGAAPLHSNPTEYVASTWLHNGYDRKFREKVLAMGERLGAWIRSQGFLGCFHPDFLLGEDGEIYLTELNMRFGGSFGAYSRIQAWEDRIPLLALHALAFVEPTLDLDIDRINEQNLEPLNYSHVVFKNNFGHPVTIPPSLQSGWYDFDGTQFTPSTNSGWNTPGRVYITGLPDTGHPTVATEGSFLCEAMVRYPISDSRSSLNQDGQALATALRSLFSA